MVRATEIKPPQAQPSFGHSRRAAESAPATRARTLAARGRWLVDGEGQPYNYQRLAAWEFAYDDPRARYMARELDPSSLVPSGPAAWTDYLGTSPWGDFDLTYSGSTPVVSEQMRYLGTAAQQEVSSGDTRHYHGDLIGSTMLLTDEAGGTNFSPSSFAYTAFGEPVTPDGSGGWRVGQPVSGAPRYAYAGEWGYETWHGSSGPMFLAGANPNLAPIRLSHVGARWYDAAIGRFVQRDPIGLSGGINLFGYVDSAPTILVDPTGLKKVKTDWGWRNPANGRWTTPPFRLRLVKFVSKLPPYLAGRLLARWVVTTAGGVWDDPEWVAVDTAYWCLQAAAVPPCTCPSCAPSPRPGDSRPSFIGKW